MSAALTGTGAPACICKCKNNGMAGATPEIHKHKTRSLVSRGSEAGPAHGDRMHPAQTSRCGCQRHRGRDAGEHCEEAEEEVGKSTR